jgi:excisionase family DNA binding protein
VLAGSMSATVHLPPQRRPIKARTYSVHQVSQITSLSLRKINAMIRDGRLKSIRIDGRRLIYVSSVEALLPDD